jgi:hypothetical protein
MRISILSGVLAAVAFGAFGTVATAGELGVDVTIKGEIVPGVYGRVDLTNRPRPPLVYAQPVIIERPAPRVVVEPIYLHVPPGHAKNWRKHCHEYHACNRPVYFVKSAEYDPGYRRDDHDHGHGHDNEHGHGHDRR